MRQICEALGINKSTLYYQAKTDASEDILREEIERLAARYPTYGYRRITKLLVRMGYDVGYRRVARLMKAANLSVSVKRICQTTHSIEGMHPWVNRLKDLEVSRCDQVWVGDITYIRLKAHFVYVSLLMDVFTRRIRGWQVSQHLTQPLTLKPLERALCQSVVEIHHSDQGVQYLSNVYLSTLAEHGVEISGVSLADVLGRTGMLRDSSAHSKRKKFTSMTTKTFTKRERVLSSLSNRCITRNAHMRR